jgi:SET and MYND domain-containing protein
MKAIISRSLFASSTDLWWEMRLGSLVTLEPAVAEKTSTTQLTITYLDPILPLVERQTFLQQRYGFTCKCPLCTYQESIPPSLRAQAPPPTPQALSKLFASVVGPALTQAKGQVADLLNGSSALDVLAELGLPTNVKLKVPHGLLGCLKPEVVTELTSIYSDACAEGEWQVAAVTGCHILGIYVTTYGWRYPLVGECFRE